MATGRLLEHDDITTVDDGTYTYEESDESKAFREFKESFDDEKMGKLRVLRIPDSKTVTNKGALKNKYLFSCTIDQFDFDSLIEYLRDYYGGGMFRLIGTRPGQQGPAFNRIIEIEKPIDLGYMGALNKSDPLKRSDNSSDIIDRMGAVLLESQQRMEEMFTNLVGPRDGMGAFSQLTEMMKAMGTMMGAIGFKPQEQKSLTDQLTEFKLLQELFDGGSGRGGNGIYDLLTATVQNFGPLLQVALTQGKRDGSVSPEGMILPPRLAAPNPGPQNQPEQTVIKSELEIMRPQIAFLIGQAKLGAKPVDVAKWVIKAIPDDKLENVEAFLRRENCIEECTKLVPELAQYNLWFVEWRKTVLEELAKILTDDQIEEPDLSHLELSESDDLTAALESAQTSPGSVAGEQTAERASKSERKKPSNIDGDTVGSGGN